MSASEDPSADLALLNGVAGFLRSVAIPVLVVDEVGVVTFANAQAQDLFGYPAPGLVGLDVDALVPDAVRPRHAGRPTVSQREPAAQGVATGPLLVARRHDGTLVPVEISLTPASLSDGRRWTVAGVTDVSERIRATRHLDELNRSYLTLVSLNQAVVRAVDIGSLFDATCRIAVEQGGFVGALVAVPDVAGVVSVVASRGRLGKGRQDPQVVLDPEAPGGLGPTAVALRENRSCFSADFLHDANTSLWHESAAREGIRASASLPLRQNGAAVAALTLYAEHEGAFDHGVGELFEQVADNVSFAMEGFAAVSRLRHEEAQRRDLVRRLVTAQETERARIAADIHDDSVQSLAAVELRLGLLRRRMGDLAPDLVPMMDQVSTTIRAAAAGLRNLLFELEPAAEGESWTTALRAAGEQVFEDRPVTCSVRSVDDDDAVALADAERVQAMRIVKEALINVRKHAGATRVDIEVAGTPAGVEISVTDDGVGFPPGVDPNHVTAGPGHRGLLTMRDRAAAAGGWCRLERVATGGTRLRFLIPSGLPSATPAPALLPSPPEHA